MNQKIEELTNARDVKGVIEMFWSRDTQDHSSALGNIEDAARAIEKIDDPGVVEPLIDFLGRRKEFTDAVINRYLELWSDRPYMSAEQAKDSALAKYQTIQFAAIRIFEKFGGEKAAAQLRRMAGSDPDSDVRDDAENAWQRLQEKKAGATQGSG